MTAKPDDTAALRVSITAAEAMSGTTRKILVPTEGSPREPTMRIPRAAPDNALLRLAGQGPDGADIFVRLAVASGNAPSRTARRWIPVLAVLVTIGAILALTLLKPADSKQSATSATTSNTPTTEPTASTTNTSTTETTTSSYTPSTTDIVPPVAPTSTRAEAAPEDVVGVGGCLQNKEPPPAHTWSPRPVHLVRSKCSPEVGAWAVARSVNLWMKEKEKSGEFTMPLVE